MVLYYRTFFLTVIDTFNLITHNYIYVFLFGRLIGLAIDRYETPSQVWYSLIRSVYATTSVTDCRDSDLSLEMTMQPCPPSTNRGQ